MSKSEAIFQRFQEAQLGIYEIAHLWLYLYPEDIFPKLDKYSHEGQGCVVNIRENMKQILRLKREGKEIQKRCH